MDVHTQLSEAISEFTAWHQPWDFHRRILQSPHLDADGQAAFHALWRRAADSPHWRSSGELAVAAATMRRSLHEGEPLLTAAAVDSIVRAVSWEWR